MNQNEMINFPDGNLRNLFCFLFVYNSLIKKAKDTNTFAFAWGIICILHRFYYKNRLRYMKN